MRSATHVTRSGAKAGTYADGNHGPLGYASNVAGRRQQAFRRFAVVTLRHSNVARVNSHFYEDFVPQRTEVIGQQG